MSLEFLKVHYLEISYAGQYSRKAPTETRVITACGRWSPDWARRTTHDPDLVTCQPCLDVLVARELAK